MKEAKDVTAFVWDHGFCVDHAVRLAQGFKRVLYHCPWQQQYPSLAIEGIGQGMENIELVESPFPWLRGSKFAEVDCWVFPWLYDADAQVWLEEEGKPVWGAKHGEQL